MILSGNKDEGACSGANVGSHRPYVRYGAQYTYKVPPNGPSAIAEMNRVAASKGGRCFQVCCSKVKLFLLRRPHESCRSHGGSGGRGEGGGRAGDGGEVGRRRGGFGGEEGQEEGGRWGFANVRFRMNHAALSINRL